MKIEITLDHFKPNGAKRFGWRNNSESYLKCNFTSIIRNDNNEVVLEKKYRGYGPYPYKYQVELDNIHNDLRLFLVNEIGDNLTKKEFKQYLKVFYKALEKQCKDDEVGYWDGNFDTLLDDTPISLFDYKKETLDSKSINKKYQKKYIQQILKTIKKEKAFECDEGHRKSTLYILFHDLQSTLNVFDTLNIKLTHEDIHQSDYDFTIEEKVKLLIYNGSDVNTKDEDGFTLLHRAAARGHAETVRLLIELGADVNARDTWERTPLCWPSFYGHKDIVKLLIDNGADVNAKDEDGVTPLHWAAGEGSMDLAKARGDSMRLASYHDRTEIVKLMIEHGADVNANIGKRNTPLRWAANEGHTDNVKLLIECGADAKDNSLHKASSKGHAEIVKLLIEHDADVNAKDRANFTPLIWAIAFDHVEIVKLLIEHGADVNAKDREHKTPLHWALINGEDTEIVEQLKQAGAKKG